MEWVRFMLSAIKQCKMVCSDITKAIVMTLTHYTFIQCVNEGNCLTKSSIALAFACNVAIASIEFELSQSQRSNLTA